MRQATASQLSVHGGKRFYEAGRMVVAFLAKMGSSPLVDRFRLI